MHPHSSCRAWQLQAHRPRRIPRFIASIHNRRIHSQRLLPLSFPSTCRVPDTDSPRRPHPPQRTHAPLHSSYLHSLPSHLPTPSIEPPQDDTPHEHAQISASAASPYARRGRDAGTLRCHWDNSPRFLEAGHVSCRCPDGGGGGERAETVFLLGVRECAQVRSPQWRSTSAFSFGSWKGRIL